MNKIDNESITKVVLHSENTVTLRKVFALECDNEAVTIQTFGLPLIKRGDIFGVDVHAIGADVEFYPDMLCYKVHVSAAVDSVTTTTYYFMR